MRKKRKRWSTRAKKPEKVKCPECGKEVLKQGLGGHMFIMHHIRSSKDYRIRVLEEELKKLKQQYEEKSKEVGKTALENFNLQQERISLKNKISSLEKENKKLWDKIHKKAWEDIKKWKCEKCGITFEKYIEESVFPEFHIRWDKEKGRIQVRCWNCPF